MTRWLGSLVPVVAVALAAALSLTPALGCRKAEARGEHVADGAELFVAACARCHGRDGLGGAPVAQLAGGASVAPRNFHDAAFQRSRSDAEIRATIVGGKSGVMPAFAAVFDDAQLDALVAHVRSFDPGRAKEGDR